jgi:hypothetical protein
MDLVYDLHFYMEALAEKQMAGRSTRNTQAYNDLKELAAANPKFFSLCKLHEIKAWHQFRTSILGLQFFFININPPNLIETIGEHKGSRCNEAADEASLVLEKDEYVEEVRGRAEDAVDYLFIKTNHGRYLELGNPKGSGAFRFTIPEGKGVVSFEIGIDEGLDFISIQTMPITHIKLTHVDRRPLFVGYAAPPFIVKCSEYFGVRSYQRFPKLHDDFWEFGLQPHVRERKCHLTKVTVVCQGMLLGMQLTYNVESSPKTSSFNYEEAASNEAEVSSCDLAEDEDIVAVAGRSNAQGIQALQLTTSKRNVYEWGDFTSGEEFVLSGVRVVAFRGEWGQVLEGLNVYYVE